MNAAQIAQLQRRRQDDPGIRFYSYAEQGLDLELAYSEFRQKLPDEAGELVYQPVSALGGVYEIDLNNVLFGSDAASWVAFTPYAPGAHVKTGVGAVYNCIGAGVSGAVAPSGQFPTLDGTVTWAYLCGAQPHAAKITRVQCVDPSTGVFLYQFMDVNSQRTLKQQTYFGRSIQQSYLPCRWWLDGRKVRFSRPVTETLQFWFRPSSPVIDWIPAIGPGANVYVDDFEDWHEIIAMIAAQSYGIKNGKANMVLDNRLAQRIQEMQDFFASSRSGDASRWVQDE